MVAGLAAIFYLPSLIPMQPTASDSYLFGYNNRVGIALMLLLLCLGVVWTGGLNLRFREKTEISQVAPLRTLLGALLAVLCGCFAMYMFAGRFGGFAESSYEIDRAWLLQQGRLPYVDFEWPFGVALLYGPLLTSRFFAVGIITAYYIFWTINCLLGTALLFAVINLIDYPSRSRKAIFFLLFGGWFLNIISMGTHYTLVRYICPLFFVLILEKAFNGSSIKSRIYAALMAVAFTIVLFSISPETAIAFIFACACIFLFSKPDWGISSLAVMGGVAAICRGCFRRRLETSRTRYSQGIRRGSR